MRKLFEKHETLCCILLIAVYLVINSFCQQNFGVADLRTVLINTALSLAVILLTVNLKRTAYYGLTKVPHGKKYLYFLPLVLIVSVNLWSGIHIQNSAREIFFHILTMCNIGFLEEIIFRGFLFKMMERDNVKAAIAVSSITFGVGHIINLFNGAAVVPTMLQIIYAMSVGYLFVILFYKSKSLVPCILTHAAFNALSVFYAENAVLAYIVPIFLTVVPLGYAIYLNRTIDDSKTTHS